MNLSVAAAKQSGRLYLPRIDEPRRLKEALVTLKRDFGRGHFLLGSLNPESPSVFSQDFGGRDVVAVVGPEGGITEDEENLLKDNGAQSVRLTSTVLRVETAALAFAAILAARRDAAGPKES